MSGGDILGVGISGLLAFQRALATTGHNISNANTEGYSRQRVELATQPPQYSGAGYIGQGVRVDSVRRLYDGFLTDQVRTGTSSYQQLERFHALASQVDNLLADSDAGLTSAMQDFFNAVQGVANNPASVPVRQVLLSEAGSLSERFHYLDQRLGDLDQNLNSQIRTSVTEVNNIAAQLAELNRRIQMLPGQGIDPPANDLLDQRDLLVSRLTEHVSVTTTQQDDGSLNVFIGNGQALVIGTQAMSLSAVASEYDANRYEVGYTAGGTTANVSGQITGGTLGAALAFRSQILDPARNSLGRIAIGLAETFNEQHALGVDLDGNLGGDFFDTIGGTSPTVLRSSANASAGTPVAVTVDDASLLTTSDYVLQHNGANSYTLTRALDGQTFTINAGGYPYTTTTDAGGTPLDGLSVTLSAAPTAGDRFLIRPTRNASRDFGVALTDARDVAAAGPLLGSAAMANTGSGQLASVSVTSATGLPLSGGNGAITLTYNSVALQFNVTDGSGLVGTVNYDPSSGSGAMLTLPAPLGFINIQMTGAPANGDAFTIADNTSGQGDNRNALALAGLQNARTLAGGTASYGDAYGQVVADVGSRTRSADIGRQAQLNVRDQAIAAREAVSGVNLDEEAADLVRFQQAYQAAAQVMSVADTMFQTLLFALRG